MQDEREVAKVESRIARAEGDYLDGKLSAKRWERLEAKLIPELEAARAQVEQHSRKRQEGEAVISEFDAQTVIVERLFALREQIVGEVQEGSHDLDCFRALLRRLFDRFELVPNDDGYLLVPWVRVRTIAGTENWDFEAAGPGVLDLSLNPNTPKRV